MNIYENNYYFDIYNFNTKNKLMGILKPVEYINYLYGLKIANNINNEKN